LEPDRGGIPVTNALQQIISKIRPGVTGAALTLTAALGLAGVATPSAKAQTFNLLYSFCSQSNCKDGNTPIAGVIQDAKGNLYGTTSLGGTSNWGTVFDLDSSGTETVLYNFSYTNGDGANPFGSLIRDAAGNLYGAANYGGPNGQGLVFKLDHNGKQTVLHNFTGGTKDGCAPYAGLIRDKAGNLYGTTVACGAYGYGMVFKLIAAGKERILHSFAGPPTDAANPFFGASLIMDAKGNLYGSTYLGGAFGSGAVYKLTPSGKETVLHSFTGGTDGCLPYGAPVMDKLGNLYGTTSQCGSSFEGTVWKLNKSGKVTVLHTFTGTDGGDPQAGVILDARGNLYGTSALGGANDRGTVFKLSASTLTVLYSFCSLSSCADGTFPAAALIRDAKGNLYGTTEFNGSGNGGTVWKLTP
jgi:uncharacterized repeat protein (TIGR03803 family)